MGLQASCPLSADCPLVFSTPVPVCVHGTYARYLDSIFREGLKTMNRNHVHFATGLPKEDGVISGALLPFLIFRTWALICPVPKRNSIRVGHGKRVIACGGWCLHLVGISLWEPSQTGVAEGKALSGQRKRQNGRLMRIRRGCSHAKLGASKCLEAASWLLE